MESSHDRVGSEVTAFASRLQETIDANDLGRIRTVLAEQVQQMKEWVSSLHSQAAAELDPLQLHCVCLKKGSGTPKTSPPPTP